MVLICIFLFANGVPAMKEIGLLDFLTGAKWKPGNDIYGIPPMILGSLYITAGAIVIGVPIDLLTAVFGNSTVRKSCNGLPVAVHRAAGRYSVHRIRLLRHGHYRTGSSCGGRCAGADISGSSILAWRPSCSAFDPADHYRRVRKRRCVRFR